MSYLTLLDQAVNTTLDSNRIGTPVFIRWTAAVTEHKDLLKPHLAEMTTHATRWLNAPPQCLYVTGTVAQGHLTGSLDYANGCTALLALTLAHERPHVNLAIYGNRGAIYHNDFIQPTRDGPLTRQLNRDIPDGDSVTFDAGANDASAHDTKAYDILLTAIERSLATQAPVTLTERGGGS